MEISQLEGFDLGPRDVAYEARDAILYALAVGGSAAQLDLVYERHLRVLPTFACALGLWAVEMTGGLGAYDRERSLHASQILVMHRPMPRAGVIATHGKVRAVWDKLKATIVEIGVSSEVFEATYTIFLPGIGNWGGRPGPSASAGEPPRDRGCTRASYRTSPDQSALYRLTGDLHPVHIDPDVAKANGFDRPILHGLCTLGIAARLLGEANGHHPCDLRSLKARLSAPVMPGDAIGVSAQRTGQTLHFQANVNERIVLKSGEVVFAS